MFEQYVNPAMKDLVALKEQNIRVVLNQLVPGFIMTDIKHRLCFVQRVGDPVETLCLDGKPIMEFYPLEMTQEDAGEFVRFKATQRYRRL